VKKVDIAILAVLATAITVEALWFIVPLVYDIYKALERM